MHSNPAGAHWAAPVRRRRHPRTRRGSRIVVALCALLLLPAASRPKKAELQLRFGVEMAQKGSWKEAQFRFQKASELAPDDPEILNNLAVAYENNGRYDDAERTYLQALQIDAGNDRIRSNYERFRVFHEDLKQKHAERGAGPAEKGSGGSR